MGCKNDSKPGTETPTVFVQESDSGFQLIRNGAPFLIKGAAGDPSYLEDLKEAGGNTLRVYDTINLGETLNRAEELGIAVVVDIPLPRYDRFPEYYEEDSLFIPIKKEVQKIIASYKDYPALLYWNLGNEIHYPGFYRNLNFFSNYHGLLDLIHEMDGNHPVSTPIAGGHRNIMTSILIRNPKLNFISINIFGEITKIHERPEFNTFFWKQPYVISEWGSNGPWEREFLTSWGAPIEESSTLKAHVIKERYFSPVQVTSSSLGNIVFYWGEKIEGTPTWLSLFGNDGLKTQAVFELEKIWKGHSGIFPGPKIEELLLEGKQAPQNILLTPGTRAEAEVIFESDQKVNFKWELRKESWNDFLNTEVVNDIIFLPEENKVIFTTPLQEGPYRLFIYMTNETEYFATANIPFYVLNPENGE